MENGSKILSDAKNLLETGIRICQEPDGPSAYQEMLEEDLRMVQRFLKAKTYRELAEELEKVTLHPLAVPYVTNVTAGTVEDIGKTRELLAEQVSSPVRWMQSMERMIADGVDTFVEIGPGKTLEGFLRKIDRSVKVFHISQWEDVDKVCTELADSGKMMEEA